MYGPVATRWRPYSPGAVSHPATSSGIGAVAGSARRWMKSPRGAVSVKEMVRSSGVRIPVIVVARPAAKSAIPAIASYW